MTDLTRAQLDVLRRLDQGWVMDSCGRDGMAAEMVLGRGKGIRRIAARTVSFLLREGLIELALDGITDYRITEAGRILLHRQRELIP